VEQLEDAEQDESLDEDDGGEWDHRAGTALYGGGYDGEEEEDGPKVEDFYLGEFPGQAHLPIRLTDPNAPQLPPAQQPANPEDQPNQPDWNISFGDYTRIHPPPVAAIPNPPHPNVPILYPNDITTHPLALPGLKEELERLATRSALHLKHDCTVSLDEVKDRFKIIARSIYRVAFDHTTPTPRPVVMVFPRMTRKRTFILNELVSYSKSQLHLENYVTGKQLTRTWASWEGKELLTVSKVGDEFVVGMDEEDCINRGIEWTRLL